MSEPYPLPSYACSVWVVGDHLMIAFPGVGTTKGHTIKLPASAGGLQAAINIMKERERSADRRIGNAGSPTQYDIERQAGAAWGKATRMLREAAEAKAAEKNEKKLAEHTAKMRRLAREKTEAEEFLKELGL